MQKDMRGWVWLFLVFFLSLAIPWKPARSQSDSTSSQIQIATQINQTKVPLNRTLELKVTISWSGTADRYDIINFDNPALTNFEIVGTATTSRTEVNHVFKDYTYTLKPLELGMGYVEGVIVKAHDRVLDKDENLVTQRIPIEVIEAVPEPGEVTFPWFPLLGGVLVVAGGIGAFLGYRTNRKKKQAEPIQPEIPIESNFLSELREQVDLNHPKLREDFATISRLLRRYLREKFANHAMGHTTEELDRGLAGTSLEENQIASIKEVFRRCDEVKFSGIEGTLEELNRFYTLFEGILESFLRKVETQSGATQAKE